MVEFHGGVPIFINNIILNDNEEEKYYVSYNSSRRDYGIDTTALVITIGKNERTVFYILENNHSEGYANCNNLKECINYLMDNKSLIHPFSNKFEHEHLLDTINI